jgi:DNA-directed RNA polymerase specialized sigma24 family protein
MQDDKEEVKIYMESLDDTSKIDQDCRAELTYLDEYFAEETLKDKDNIRGILLKLVGEEIKRLPETQRDVLIRFYMFSESDAIIAKPLGCNRNSVTDRRHRAITTLKKRLLDNPHITDLLEKLHRVEGKIDYKYLDDFIKIVTSIK